MSYLVEIALGPVQGFIAAGRNTRDLAFGSWMLQDMARHVAHELKNRGFMLIFPTDSNQASTNKIMAVTPSGVISTDIADILSAVEKSTRDYICNLATTVLKPLTTTIGVSSSPMNLQQALWQFNEVIEF